MALYPQPKAIQDFAVVGGGSVALGSKLKLVIERTNKRLEKIRVRIPVTLSGTFGATAARNLLEGVASSVLFKVSEKGRTSGSVVDSNSATLIHRQRKLVGEVDRYTAAAMRASANGTYYVYFDVPLVPDNISELIAYRFAMPLDESVQGADPVLEITLAPNAAAIGMTGNVAIGTCQAQLFYRDLRVEDGWDYVPTELVTTVYTWPQTSETAWPFPNEGLLANFQLETFTSATARGDILAAGKKWTTKLGRNVLADSDEGFSVVENDQWADSSAYTASTLGVGVKPNETSVQMWDFLHDTPLREALNADSVPSLYTQNGGDNLKLIHNGISSPSLESYITHFKFLTPDRSRLRGA